MTTSTTPAATAPGHRDRYVDALRAVALLVVVFGHWLATLPIPDAAGNIVDTEHLLATWEGSGWLTWALQVVPLFVFVSAAVNGPSLLRSEERGETFPAWFRSRLHGLSKPVAVYLTGWVVIASVVRLGAALDVPTADGAWRVLGYFDQSLTIHLWFIAMIVATQLLLPIAIHLDRRASWRAVFGLLAAAAVVDALRFFVLDDAPLAGVPNVLLIWMVPQQLGILWSRANLTKRHGGLFVGLGLGGLLAGVAAGYPIALVGGDIGDSNVVPPTLMIGAVSVMQAGLVVLLAKPARALLQRRAVWGSVQVMGAVGMPLYLWHKSFEPLVASLLSLVDRVDLVAGTHPTDPGFWLHRLTWIGLLLTVTLPFAAWQLAKVRRERAVPRSEPAGVELPPTPGRVWGGAIAVVVSIFVTIVAGVTAIPELAAATAVLWGAVFVTRRIAQPAPAGATRNEAPQLA